ncbi:MAG TPA: SusC/RagA family TonB-linked outer membrane protein [Dysgonamonadaceae bacterium]|nr:SusC/RagA family TonB-linked outer membrane protein [Dysgonamonadaceae bacterium]
MIKNHKTSRLRRIFGCNLLLLIFTLPLTAQDLLVTGKVTDGNLPISGASIIVKNTTTGAVSDFDGRYRITAQPTDTLLVSYLGYTILTIPIQNRTYIDITLKEDTTALGEVRINAGYYTVKDRERTGSIVRVTAKDIEGLPIVSPLEALQGRMAGVEVTLGSGITGLAPSIRIRGTNSLRNDGNYPLYIINGIPLNSEPLRSAGQLTNLSGLDPLSTLNPNTIESIEVLKDADATAIYGSRGANGVVLITTKKKSSIDKKTSLSINILSGISEVANKMKLLNTPQYLSMRKQAFENDGVIPTQANAPDLILWDQNRYTDWQEVLFGGTAFMTNVNIGVSGGNEYTSYLIGGSYQNQSSIFPGNFDYNKGTANLNLNHRSKDNRFLLDLSVNYGIDNNSLFFGSNFVNFALTTPPNAPAIYKEDGSLNWENWIGDNPLAVLEQPQDIHTDNLLTNMSLSYQILKGLQLKTNLGYSKLNSDEQIRFFREAYNPNLWDYIKLNSRQSFSKRQSWIAEPQITYDVAQGKVEVNTLIGATFQDNKNSYFALEGSGYTDKSLMKNLGAADAVRVLSDNNSHYRYSALFGRLGLNFDKKYFLNLTGRRDGSSRFGPDKRFSNFWALGGVWIFTEESFFKNSTPFISFGKLRASYGTTGSDQIGDYNFLDTYQPTDGAGGLYPTQLFNANYSWEVNKKLEAAMELGFFNDRIHLEVSWHRNRSSNQLVGYPLPAITGFTSIQANLPALVQNTGWEIQLLTTNVMNKHFKWQTSLNITIPENKLVKFDDIEKTSYANRYEIGYPLDIRKLYQYDGIDQETGYYRVVDVNDDGRYNYDDRVVVKNMGRKYYGGINNYFRYKGFSLQFLFEYIKQNNLSYIFDGTPPGFRGNKPLKFLNAWEKSGDNEQIQKVSQSFSALISSNNASNSSRAIEDASFLRMKNISFSYQLPNNLLEKINIQSGRLYLQAYNLFTITPYKGLDPQGGRAIPPLRTISFGVNLNL